MDWRSMDNYPEPEKRVLVATDDGTVGVGYWHPEAGWLLEVEMGETECEPLYWMPLPEHPQSISAHATHH